MININLSAESFSELYEKLADLLHQIHTPAPVVNPTPAQATAAPASAPVTPAMLPAAVAPVSAPGVAPVTAPAAVSTAAPAVPVSTPVSAAPAPAAQAAPVTPMPTAAAPTYTLEQLGRATCALSDANRVPEIQDLFAAFAVSALTELRPDQYGAYAAALRQKGVTI